MGIAMPFGNPGSESINLNVDSLWSGGPFECSVGPREASFFYFYSPLARIIQAAIRQPKNQRIYQESDNGYFRTEQETSHSY